jgi:hypothetical protein
MTHIIQGRQRPRDLANILSAINDPKGRRWRVVALDGVGPRLNDFELLKTLDNGAVLHVERWGQAWIDWSAAARPAPDSPASQTVAITVEADDGPVVHAADDGTPLWRGGGTRLTADWTINMRGYAPAWTAAGVKSAFSLDMTRPELTTAASTAADAGATKRATARNYVYVQSVADAAGGSVVANAVGVTRSGANPPHPFYRLPERHREAVRFSLTATQGVENAPATYAVRNWMALSAPVTARTILAVVRKVHTDGEGPILGGPDGAGHWLRYRSGGLSFGAASAEAFADGRVVSTSLAERDWTILAVRFDEARTWAFINAQDSAGTGGKSQDIRELHFVPGALSDAEIAQWMGYAAHKHDLAWKLPFDHPYRWGPPGFERPEVDPTPLPAVIRFGRLTRAGHGGWPLPYGRSHVLGGADAAAFTVVEGTLAPAANGLPNARYALTVDGAAVTVETDPGVAHIRSGDQMTAAEQALRGADVTLRWREGRFGGVVRAGAFRVAAGTTLTIDADAPRRSVFTSFAVSGNSSSTSPGALVVRGIRAHDDDARSSIIAVNTCGRVTLQDCEAHGDWIDPSTDFFNVYHDRGGAYAAQGHTQTVVETSEAHNINVAGSASCVAGPAFVRYNFIYARFGDGFIMNGAGPNSGRRWLHDNLYRDSYGRVEYYSKPHTDVFQTRFSGAVDSVANPQSLPPQQRSLITVQRCIVWQSPDNIDVATGASRRGERGFYIEGTNGNYNQHEGTISANIIFGNHETGLDVNGNNAEAVVGMDNSMVAPDGGTVGISSIRTQRRNVAHQIAARSPFRPSIFAEGGATLLEIGGADVRTLYADPSRRPGMGPHDIIAALTPLKGSPLDLGDGQTIGAVTLDGRLKPLVTTFPPGRPEPPVLALDGTQIDVTLPADPTDLGGLPVIRRDLRVAPTNNINNGSEPNWTTILDVESGVNVIADSPGDPNYARWRVVTEAGPGPWSMPSAPVTPPAVRGMGWTPAALARVIHYDAASEGSVVKSGAIVRSVANLAGGAGALAVTGAPLHGPRRLNGLPVFDCPNDASFLATGLTLPGEHTWAMVVRVDAFTNNNDALFHIGEAAVRHEVFAGGNPANGVAGFNGRTRLSGLASNETPNGAVFPSGYFAGSAWAILVTQFSREESVLRHYLNGSLLTTMGAALASIDAHEEPITVIPQGSVGIWRNGGDGLLQPSGAWAEALMVEGATTAARRRIEGYLAHRWGLASQLPSDHPYQGGAP